MENKETQHSQKREKIEMKIAQIESWMRDLEKEIAFYKQRIPEISARMSEIALKANNDAAYKEYEDLDERRFLMNHFWLPRREEDLKKLTEKVKRLRAKLGKGEKSTGSIEESQPGE